ncbi:hypothetical protein BDR26DRAFT_50444 [Obelidium mucronatum]|nr:hypothetical protein BDR26DRAFT_50444 [Obelidium mucronatum]
MNGTPAELLPRSPRQLPLHHSRDKENSNERASLDRHSASSRLEALETEYAVLNNETTASASSIQNLELENKTLRAEIDALLKEQRALIRTNTDVNDQLEEEVSSRDKTLENWRIKEQTLANTIKIQKSEIKGSRHTCGVQVFYTNGIRIRLEVSIKRSCGATKRWRDHRN